MVIRVVFGIQTHVLTSYKPTIEVNQRGEECTNENEIHVSFELTPNMQEHYGSAFAHAYYHDELKAKGFNPNYASYNGGMRKKILDTMKKKVELIVI
jgi:hypothetical protein